MTEEEKKQKKKAYLKKYREEHKEEQSSYNKKYREEHKEEIQKYRNSTKDRTKDYQEENKEQLKEYQKSYQKANKEKFETYRKANKDKRKAYQQNYHKSNPEARSTYRKNNKEKLKSWHKNYRRNKYKTDIQYKISQRLRIRLNGALKGNSKRGSAVSDLGCTIPEFKIYLESLFTEGMTWENYGSFWHLDHLKPISLFNLLDETEFKEAVHFSNIQPLSAEANIQKHNTFSESDQEKYNLLHSKYFPESDKSSPNT